MILKGPEFKNSSNTKPKQLVIMLHGYGSNGQNLIDLADSFSVALPDAYFLSPNAPNECESGGFGSYQWFSLASRAEDFMYEGMKHVSLILNRYIDDQLKRFDLTPDKLILIGFSQGSMLAMHISPRREEKIAGVVAYSGALIGARFLEKEIKSTPKMLLIHGDMDEVVSYEAMDSSLEILSKNKIEARGVTCRGLAHSINLEGVREASLFMKKICL